MENPIRFLYPVAFSVILIAGSGSATADSWTAPRTEYGQPDLQGIWFYGSATPFERPIELGDQKSYSEVEAREVIRILLDADQLKNQPLSADREAPEQGRAIAQEADHNFATSRTTLINIDGEFRTSQIVSPSNGRLPLKEGGRDYFESMLNASYGAYDGPEMRPASERCVGPNGGPAAPMVGWFYNANMQIVQTRDYVMILAEMNHDARIIPLRSGQPDYYFPQWMGNSAGHWEGDTLVVETKDFRKEQSWFAFRMSEKLTVTERFTLVSDDEMFYSYTFTDPTIYTAPVTVEKNIVRRPDGESVYEYACHEGNYSFASILAGARRLELSADD